MRPFGADRYYAELLTEATTLAAVTEAADLTRLVPACPEWTLRDLLWHLGRAHRWAATIVERRAVEPVPLDEVDVRVPDAPAERTAWLRAGAERLVGAVREAGPDTHVWTWARDRTARFWLRKMTHESVVHRLDAELTVRVDSSSVAADLAADGVSDLLDTIAVLSGDGPDPVFAGLRGNGERLAFGKWLVRRTPAGVVWTYGFGEADVSVQGRVVDLLLLLYRRAGLDDLPVHVHGDRGLLDHWLRDSAF
jgi:uncharacterized protein (TIGR03083 family)